MGGGCCCFSILKKGERYIFYLAYTVRVCVAWSEENQGVMLNANPSPVIVKGGKLNQQVAR